jgi:hypothetical protein
MREPAYGGTWAPPQHGMHAPTLSHSMTGIWPEVFAARAYSGKQGEHDRKPSFRMWAPEGRPVL